MQRRRHTAGGQGARLSCALRRLQLSYGQPGSQAGAVRKDSLEMEMEEVPAKW